jgi:hypothetical protein
MPTTLVSVERLPETSSEGDTRGTQTEMHAYRVTFSDSGATAVDARNATGVPAYGAQLTTAIAGAVGLYVTNKKATRIDKLPTSFRVDVTYTAPDSVSQPSEPAGYTPGDKYGVQVAMRNQPYTIAIQKDINDEVLVNVNGEPYDPPVVLKKSDQNLVVSFWTSSPGQAAIDACIDHINSSSHTMTIGSSTWSFPAETLYFDSYQWTVAYNPDGDPVFNVEFAFIYRVDGWQEKRPNLSLYKLDTGTGKLQPILDKNNQPVTSPQYLDASRVVIPDGDDIVTRDWDIIPTASFTTLLSGIP